MVALIVRLIETSRRHAAIMAAMFLLAAIAGGLFAAQRISIDSDIDKLINPNLSWRKQEAALEKAFPENANRLVVVLDAMTADQAEDAANELAAALSEAKTVFKTVRLPDESHFFKRNGLLFLPKEQVQDFADQIIAAQPLIGTLAADPSLRGVFDALDLVAQGIKHGEAESKELDTAFDAVAVAVEAALVGKHEPMSWQTLLTGRKPGSSQLRRFIQTQPVLDYADVEPGARATSFIHATAKKMGLTPANGVHVRITGPVALSDAQFSTLEKGAGLSSGLLVGLLCLWLILAVRSLRLFAAIAATLIVGLIGCAVFAVAAVGPLNPISAAFAVLFVGIAIDFGIQFSVRYRDERYRADDLAEALRRTARGIGGPLSLAAGATAVGFFSFVPTDYTGVSDLGIIAGMGMIIALVLNFTLLPALLTLLRPPGEPRPVGFLRAAPIDRFLVMHRWPILGIAAMIGIGSVATLNWLSFDFNPLHLQNPHEEAVSTLFDLMKDPDTTPYTISVLAPSVPSISEIADRAESLPEVARVLTIESFVPSDQQERLAILTDASQLLGPTLSPTQVKAKPNDDEVLSAIRRCDMELKAVSQRKPTATRLVKALDTVLARGPTVLPALDANLASGLKGRLDDLRLALSAQPVTIETLPPDLKRQWIAADGQARAEIFPKGDTNDNEVLRRFADAVRRVAPDATGTPISIQESARTVIRAFVIAGSIALVAIAVLLSVVLLRWRDVLLVLCPLILAGLLTLATSVILGLPLNFANIITLPLLLGIGVAFDVYFVMRWRAGQGDLLQSSTARAILYSALTTGTAFGSLALSNYPGMSEMGKLLTLALLYTLLCTFVVLPALLGPVRR